MLTFGWEIQTIYFFSSLPVLSGPYAHQPWYYGRLTRDETDVLLNSSGADGDFLVRDSESNVSFKSEFLHKKQKSIKLITDFQHPTGKKTMNICKLYEAVGGAILQAS